MLHTFRRISKVLTGLALDGAEVGTEELADCTRCLPTAANRARRKSAGPAPADMRLPLDHRRLLHLSLGRGGFDEFAPRGANSTKRLLLETFRAEKPKVFCAFFGVQIPFASDF
jgi:hypothetical protein